MNLTILGSGSATPTISRNPTAQLLEASGRFFLIDCGEGTQLSLLKRKVSANKIDHIFISHLHGDHWLGLPGLISSMHLNNRKKTLHIYCHKGLEDLLKLIFQISSTVLQFEIVFHFHTQEVKQLIFENSYLSFFSFPLKHRIPCNGFLIKEKTKLRNIRREALNVFRIPVADLDSIKRGMDWISPEGKFVSNALLTKDPMPPKSFAFCSDTIFDLDLIPILGGVDLLYHEATFLEDMEARAIQTYHTTARQAGLIAKQANVKKLLIGHYSSRYKQFDLFSQQVKAVFSNTILAYDGLEVEV